MRVNEKYSYSKYRSSDSRPVGSGKVFVAPKIKYPHNPTINLPRKFWSNIFLLLVILSVIWLLLYSPFFRINEIIVEGNKLVPAEQITTQVENGENIFRFDLDGARKKIIAKNPMIEDLVIYRGIPNALKIVVLEKEPAFVWQSRGKSYLVDDTGIVDREITPDEFNDLLKIVDQKNLEVKIGSQIVSMDFIAFVKKINDDFFANTNIKISGYQVAETTFDLIVTTEAGFYLKFDTTRSAEKQLSDLKNIIITYRDSIHEYVDMRINGWAYYK